MEHWTNVEFENIALGDKRLNKRATKILDVLGGKPENSIPQAFHSRAEAQACYRFFDSDLVTEEKLLTPHFEATLNRIKQYPVVLIDSDTTSLNFTGRKALEKSGYISSNNAQGFFMHTSIALTPERQSLGVVGNKLWGRAKEKVKQVHRDLRPIEDKENIRWIESYRNACDIASMCTETQIVNIVDREGDFYELLLEAQEQQKNKQSAHIIIRGRYDRVLTSLDGKQCRLRKTLQQSLELGRVCFDLSGRDEQPDRKVTQSYKATEVTIKERNKVGVESKSIAINAVLLEEVDCPEGIEPICWILLTTLPINSLEEVKKVIEYYLCRWEIEVFFKTFKSGCKVEEKQLRTAPRLFSLFTLFLIITWRVHYLMNLSRTNPTACCTVVFEDAEWKSGYMAATRQRTLPKSPPTLEEMMKYIGMLGGYLNRKSDPPPGAKVIWKGIVRLRDYSDAWDMFGPESDTKQTFFVKKSYA